jgi:hypothetical protein
VEGKKGMRRRWKECWTVNDCGRKERNGKKIREMVEDVVFWRD